MLLEVCSTILVYYVVGLIFCIVTYKLTNLTVEHYINTNKRK